MDKEKTQNLDESQSPKLNRVLSLPYLVAFGLAYLAPTVVFNYYGIITQMTRGMMAIAYVATTIVMFFTAYSYARMVEAYPVAGSAYTYVQRSVNPYVGFIAGWLMLLDYLLVPMICYLLLGIYINEFFPIIQVWAIVVFFVVFGAAINIIGVKTAARINTVIIACQIAFTALFIGVIIKFVSGGGGADTMVSAAAIYNPAEFSAANILAAASILAVSFLGFDAVTTMAEETIDPKKTVGRAIMIVCVGAGVAFAVVSYFSQLAWPAAYLEIQDPDAGIFELLSTIGSFMPNLFFITDNLASFVCAMAGLAAVSRILYGMGRDGSLPKKFFGYLHPRFQTPITNIILTSLIALSAIFYADNLLGAASLVSFGALSGFLLVNLSVIMHYYVRGKKRSGLDIIRYLLMPGIGMLVCAVLWFNIDSSAKILGSCWLVAGLIVCAASTNFFRRLPPELNMSEDEQEAS